MSTNKVKNKAMRSILKAEKKLDFATILASSVHDMKNSLGILLNSIDDLLEEQKQGPSHDEHNEHDVKRTVDPRLTQLQYEAMRVNNYLIQLMALYKLDRNQYPLSIEEYDVEEFLLEQLYRNQPLLDGANIKASISAEPGLMWFFDQNLIAGTINNIFTNAIRYTKSRLKIAAFLQEDYLVISVEDDGKGYPAAMLEDSLDFQSEVDFNTGSTGFGLYFSAQVAELHRHNKRQGFIRLRNGGAFGGGCFSIHLP